MTFINVCIFIHFHSKKMWREVIVLKLIEFFEWWHDYFISKDTGLDRFKLCTNSDSIKSHMNRF